MLRNRRLAPLVCLLLALPASAQEQGGAPPPPPEMVTDRPDQTESALTVPPGYVQVETGWLFTREDSSGLRLESHGLPGTLARIGVASGLELRAGWSGYVRDQTRLGAFEVAEEGAGDAEVGAKLRLTSESGLRPEIAFLAGASLPVGSAGVSSERVDPAFRFSVAHTLSDRLALGYNLGMVWDSDSDETGNRATLSNYLYTLSLGVGLTERLGSFIEVFGEMGASAPGPPAHSLDGGFTYLVRPNLQFDVSAGVGLSAAAEDWFVGLGFSVRLPE